MIYEDTLLDDLVLIFWSNLSTNLNKIKQILRSQSLLSDYRQFMLKLVLMIPKDNIFLFNERIE